MVAEWHLVYLSDSQRCARGGPCRNSSTGGSFLDRGYRATVYTTKSDIERMPDSYIKRLDSALPPGPAAEGGTPKPDDPEASVIDRVSKALRCVEAQASFRFVALGCETLRSPSFLRPINPAFVQFWREVVRHDPDARLYRGTRGVHATLLLIALTVVSLALAASRMLWREREDQRPK